MEEIAKKPKRARKKVVKPIPQESVTHMGIEREQLRDFVYFAIGDPQLNPWEANFVNGMKERLYGDHNAYKFSPYLIYISKKQGRIIEQIKIKLRHGKPESSQNENDDLDDEPEYDDVGRIIKKNQYDNGFNVTDDDEADRILRELIDRG